MNTPQIYLIEPYNAYAPKNRKKHWHELVEEQALLARIQAEQIALQEAQKLAFVNSEITISRDTPGGLDTRRTPMIYDPIPGPNNITVKINLFDLPLEGAFYALQVSRMEYPQYYSETAGTLSFSGTTLINTGYIFDGGLLPPDNDLYLFRLTYLGGKTISVQYDGNPNTLYYIRLGFVSLLEIVPPISNILAFTTGA